MKLIFSQPGRPRGRGKIERFFRSGRRDAASGTAWIYSACETQLPLRTKETATEDSDGGQGRSKVLPDPCRI
jgi:transposase InsO family protein